MIDNDDNGCDGIDHAGIDALEMMCDIPDVDDRKLDHPETPPEPKKSRKKDAAFDKARNFLVADTCTIDKSEVSFYWRFPRSLMIKILSSMIIFDQYGLQFKIDKNTGKGYMISVYQSGTSVIQTTRMDEDNICKEGGELCVNFPVNIGFQPMKVYQLITKSAPSIPNIEISQTVKLKPGETLKTRTDNIEDGLEAALTLTIGAWTHKISLLPLDTYRHQRPEEYELDATYMFDPTALLNNLIQAKNVPSNARSVRELQIVFEFREEGVVIGTARNVADPDSKSSVLMVCESSASDSRRNCDTNSIKKIESFVQPVTQLFDLKLLQSIIKACSLLTNEIHIGVARDRPMDIAYEFKGGRTRTFIADQVNEQ